MAARDDPRGPRIALNGRGIVKILARILLCKTTHFDSCQKTGAVLQKEHDLLFIMLFDFVSRQGMTKITAKYDIGENSSTC